MTFDLTTAVGEVMLEVPNAARVFEKAGIDYCCGGGKSLADACASAGVETAELLESLDVAGRQEWQADAPQGLKEAPLTKVIAHIVDKHHVFTRQEFARLDALLVKVCSVYGQKHPELSRIRDAFKALQQDLLIHMQKEEMVLFPYIIRMEDAAARNEPPPVAMFGTVRNPVRMMMLEHDTAGELLREMRAASSGYALPPDACVSYRTLYRAFEELEADLHQHIFLENSLLFPRAVEMEGK